MCYYSQRHLDPAMAHGQVRPRPDDGSLHLRLIDFGSALDAHAVRALYGAAGPSDAQQTREYAPPEALLGRCAAPDHHVV